MSDRPIAVVVDQSKPFLMYLSILLNRMNLEVLPVDNAIDALDICRVTRPHLVTLELMMPDMDGLQALRKIREDEELRDLSVILTASGQDKNRQWEALSLGCVDVLDKPIDLRRLHKAIQRCDLYSGKRRRYMRAPFAKSVILYHQGRCQQVSSVSLSERGIYLQMTQPLAKGTHVDVELPVAPGKTIKVGGTIIYVHTEDGNTKVVRPGLAIKFDRLTNDNRNILSRLVEELLVGDIVDEQDESLFQSPLPGDTMSKDAS